MTPLTPGRIALVVLIVLYSECQLPPKSIQPIFRFIFKSMVNRSLGTDHGLSMDAIRELTDAMPSKVMARTVFDVFLKRLWSINSLEALQRFINETRPLVLKDEKNARKTNIRSTTAHFKFHRRCLPGRYIRRIRLQLLRIPFHEELQLWLSFVSFRAPTLDHWRSRKLGVGLLSFDANLQGLSRKHFVVQHAYSQSCVLLKDAPPDNEQLLEFQIECMQKLGTRLSPHLEMKLRTIVGWELGLPAQSYYALFLNAWRTGDYYNAFDNLHKYFDYTMNARDRTFYQYALLNLAILQADFGCYREAVLAMQETINTAQDNRDFRCLNFALSWQYHFYKAHPEECPAVVATRMERDSLQFLKAKAKESGPDQLLAAAYLSEAKQIFAKGDSVPAALESLYRSAFMHSCIDTTISTGPHFLSECAIWTRLGVPCLGLTSVDVFLAVHGDGSPNRDIVEAAHCHAAALSTQGRRDDAADKLLGLDYNRLVKARQFIGSALGLIRLKNELSRGKLLAGELRIKRLVATEFVEHDFLIEFARQKNELHLRKGCIKDAFGVTSRMTALMAEETADATERIRWMLASGEIFAACGKNQRAFSLAITAVNLSYRSRFLLVLYNAIVFMGKTLNALREFTTSLILVESIMPLIVECEDCELTARAILCLVDSRVGSCQTLEAESRHRQLNIALVHLGLALQESSKLGDDSLRIEILSKRARLLDVLGHVQLRDEDVQCILETRSVLETEVRTSMSLE